MFDRFVKLSVSNPVFVNLFFLIIVIAGVFTALRMPKEQFPEISLDAVSVRTVYPGATASDIEELVVRPLEDALDAVADVKLVSAVAGEGFADIQLTFLEGTDLGDAVSSVEQAISSVDGLPAGAERPVVQELTLDLPVLVVNLTGDRAIRRPADQVAERLRRVRGVSSVRVTGLAERVIAVELDEARLRSVGLPPGQVVAAIQSARVNVPAGSVSRSGSEIFVKTEQRLDGAADVARIPLAPGSPLRVGDVASVALRDEEPDTIFELDGVPAVRLLVSRETDADALRIRKDVLALTAELTELTPPGIGVQVTDDFTEQIRDRLKAVATNGLMGAVLVGLVLWLFAGGRSSLLALWGIPLSYFVAVLLMEQTGVTINVISAFGLLIATGIIVDDAVIVIENVQRHLEMGKDRVQAVLDGTKEVLSPVFVAVLTTIAAFAPLALVGGVTGRVMRILPLVVIFCLVGSLVEAIVVLPGHLSEFAQKDARDGRTARLLARLQRIYQPALSFAVRRPWPVSMAALVLVIGTFVLASTMSFSATAPAKPFFIEVTWELAPGVDRSTTVAEGRRIADQVESLLPGKVTARVMRVGSVRDPISGVVRQGANLGRLKTEFEVDSEMEKAYPGAMRELERLLATDPDLSAWDLVELEGGPPSGAAVAVRLRSRDTAQLEQAAAELMTGMRGIDGLARVRDDRGAGKETFAARVDQDRAALYGLTEMEVGSAVRTAIEGIVAAELSIDEEQVDVVVRNAGGRQLQRAGLTDLLLPTPGASAVRLEQVARVDRVRELEWINRRDGQRRIALQAELTGDLLTSRAAGEEVQSLWTSMADRFDGVELELGGENEEVGESLADLPMTFLLALGLIYALLAIQFRSYLQPLIIMTAVPFGLVGAVWGLFLLGFDLSLFALFGSIALTGIVVNDSLVMVDFINRERSGGRPLCEAVMEGARQRLRPILTTTATTVLGLAPLALGLGGSDGMIAPMATSIAVGLGFATVLLLVVVPAVYICFDDVGRLMRRRPAPAE